MPLPSARRPRGGDLKPKFLSSEDALTTTYALSLLAAAAFSGLPAQAQQHEVTDAALLAALTGHSSAWDAAFNSNSADALAALYTEDAVEVTNQGPIYGREAIRAHYETLLKTFNFSEHSGALHKSYMLSEDGSVILSHGEYSFVASDSNGNSMPLTGYWSSVSVLEDGVWRDKMQTWNVGQMATEPVTPDTLATQP
jgi:uncharacterized protein (TIGR02246 family)